MFMSLEDHCSLYKMKNDPGTGVQTLIFDLYLGRPFRSPLEGELVIFGSEVTQAYMRMNALQADLDCQSFQSSSEIKFICQTDRNYEVVSLFYPPTEVLCSAERT